MEFKLNELTDDGRRTANFSTNDTSTYMQCPYYGEHTIELARMQFHLKKCRKAFPNLPKKNCPFDRTHWINEPELKFHIQTCPKRTGFDEYKFNIGNNTAAIEPPPPPSVPEPEENWDSMEAPPYDPQQSMEGRQGIVRKIHGAQPAERRAFRMEQRQKFGRENN